MRSEKSLKKFLLCAMLGALAGGIQTAENLIFAPVPLPGGRPGIANTVTMIALHYFGIWYALAVTILKSVITLALSGSVTAFIYSVFGGAAGIFAMSAAKKIKNISPVGVGIIGAFVNNAVQTAVAARIMSSFYILSYIWVLGIVSVVTGAFTGLCCKFFTDKGLIKI